LQNIMADDFDLLLQAVAFAARAHRHQIRKDGATPYVSHVFRACLTVRHVFGIADPRVLAAAVLHDTIEDTTTDFDDLKEHFGAEVAGWVALLSKDKRLEEGPRETAYKAGLAAAPWQVQVCKLADVRDNLLDCVTSRQRERTIRRSREYLDALRSGLKVEARAAFELVERLLAGLEQSG
jgi:guanosine-3',5'-bis(diphosphate) 3'-pyrophosphohydrolase